MPRKKTPKKVALLSDVHGNLPALEAVLADAVRHDAKAIWNLGDVLGYAPFPDEVIRQLRDVHAVSIAGNYDLKVLEFKQKEGKWKKNKAPEKYVAFQWNYEHLSDAGRAFLESLPEQIRIEINGLTALLVHGSPSSVDELLGTETPEQRFRELAAAAEADLVACGHSHEAFVRRAEGTWFVNPGSVGRPEGGDWRASYALLEFTAGGLKVGHRRVPYDIDRVARAVHAAGLPEDFVAVFRKAKSLDRLWDEVGRSDQADRSPGGRSDKVLNAVLALARSCNYEREHTHQVTKLALELFDRLQGLHKMGPQERFWLKCGALLHDIGWIEGQKGHHKTALTLIMADPRLPLGRREREIVGLIARYHRKALPRAEHRYFPHLAAKDQRRVSVLAGILRIADGLDRSHLDIVKGVQCDVSDGEITVVCQAKGLAEFEVAAARNKADLLERTFDRPVTIEVRKTVK